MSGIDLSQLLAFDKLLVNTSFTSLQILLSLSVTFLIAMFIYYIYKKTYSGVLYSKNFNITLVMTAIVVNALMIGISGNLVLSLGLVGALSIVRFRTAVKDSKDTAFIFWAISIGVINGVGYYELSILFSLFMGVVIALLSRSVAFEPSYMLIIKYNREAYKTLEPILQKEFKRFFIRSDSRKGELTEKVIEIRMKNGNREQALDRIRQLKGVDSCVFLSTNGEFAE